MFFAGSSDSPALFVVKPGLQNAALVPALIGVCGGLGAGIAKVNSTKSMVGHLLGAAGGVEAIVCVKSITEGYVHPTVGLRKPGEGCDLDYVMGHGADMDVHYAMSNSLGFGGHNASILFGRYRG